MVHTCTLKSLDMAWHGMALGGLWGRKDDSIAQGLWAELECTFLAALVSLVLHEGFSLLKSVCALERLFLSRYRR